jgi:hypothetical protein
VSLDPTPHAPQMSQLSQFAEPLRFAGAGGLHVHLPAASLHGFLSSLGPLGVLQVLEFCLQFLAAHPELAGVYGPEIAAVSSAFAGLLAKYQATATTSAPAPAPAPRLP